MTTYTLTELFSKRAEIAGLIVQTEKQVRQLRADLAHVEATIRILRPGTELPKLVPRRVEFRPRYFKRGQTILPGTDRRGPATGTDARRGMRASAAQARGEVAGKDVGWIPRRGARLPRRGDEGGLQSPGRRRWA